LLKNHHSSEKLESNDDTTLHQILHLVDNLAVFSDHSRPAHWNRGYLRLRDLAPQWVHSQYQRGKISQEVNQAATDLFSEENRNLLDDIDYRSHQYPELYNALQMASLLHQGLDPQNPGLLNDLRDRHGSDIVDPIWTRALRSYLPVKEKIRVIRRLDDLAPLFARRPDVDYAFINASPRPIQLAVELIRHHLAKDRLVILMGLFPRVTKAYRRFVEHHGDEFSNSLDQIVAISGVRRLQFIRHSYPFEADFERPFHQIIREYRETHDETDNLCLIPFSEFHEYFEPTREAASRIRELEKASELEEIRIPERVETEARRYRIWKENQPTYAIDTLENERFRRIMLNNFTNREVLYFYHRTIDDRPNVQQALREVLGALRENPNYLSERSSRYSLHELVRSLSQIHFFSDEKPRAHELINEYVSNKQPHLKLIDRYGVELNFFKNTLATGIRIMEELAKPFDDLPVRAMTFALLGSGIIAEEKHLRDYLLSPEDISYNRAMRRRLISHSVPMSDMLFDTEQFQQLSTETQNTVKSLLTEANPPLAYGLFQTALYLSLYIDFSRVENWERGRRKIKSQDTRHLLPPLEKMLPRHINEDVADGILDRVRNFMNDGGDETLNRFSRPSYSYVYLFNALSLGRDLRYGLFPGGPSPFENARLLYGVNRVNLLLKGMVQSDLAAPEAVKISRKIRYLSGALQRHPVSPGEIHFLNLDRSGAWNLPEYDSDNDPMFILSGEFQNTLSFWKQLQEQHPEALPYCHTLVGEEFPVLIKETSLAYTDFLAERIQSYRRKENLVGRHLLMPIGDLFARPPEQPEPVLMSYHNKPPGLFINAWLALFDLQTGWGAHR
ncbi:MAG: hypothetical protein ABEK50_13280, partial [bacterium]